MKRPILYSIVAVLNLILAAFLLQGRLFPSAETNLVDQWREVDLSPDLLDSSLSESCYENELSFAACWLAVERIEAQLEEPTGANEGTQKTFQKIRKSYKQALQGPRYDFAKKWSELKPEILERDDRSLIIALAVNAFLYMHRDPHTLLVPQSRYDQMIKSSEKSLFGIGISIRPHGESFRITRVVPGSPAEAAGIRPGDHLLAIEGEAVEGRAHKEVQELLGNDNQKQIRLTVAGLTGSSKTLEVQKDQITYRNVESRVLSNYSNDPVIYINILRFSFDVCREVKEALQEGLAAGASSMVLDLRANPGGPLREASCVADLLLNPGLKIFEARYFDEERAKEQYDSENTPIFTYPVTVVVDAFTASAAELLAGALQDHQRALVIGERTYGKGSFQQGRLWLPYEKAVLLETQGLYHLPSGSSPQLKGLIPDLFVSINDPQTVEREADLFYKPIDLKLPSEGMETSDLLKLLSCEFGNLDSETLHRHGSAIDPVIAEASKLTFCLKGQKGLAAFGIEYGGE